MTKITVYWDATNTREGWAWVHHPNETPDCDTVSGPIAEEPDASDSLLAVRARQEFGGPADVEIDRSELPDTLWEYGTGFDHFQHVGPMTGYFRSEALALADAERGGWRDHSHFICRCCRYPDRGWAAKARQAGLDRGTHRAHENAGDDLMRNIS